MIRFRGFCALRFLLAPSSDLSGKWRGAIRIANAPREQER